MAASPVPPSTGDESSPRATSLTEWLRARSDRQLATLLRLRPDLALPAPADVPALAARVGVRTSTQRAVDGLDAPTLALLERLVVAADEADAIEPAEPPGEELATLLDLALVWGDEDLVHLTPSVRESVGPYPGGLGRPARQLFGLVGDIQLIPVLRRLGLPPAPQPQAGQAVARLFDDADRLAALVAECDQAEREILDQLAAGPPVGSVRSTRLAPASAEQSPAHRLMNRGLLVAIDTQRMELPRELGLALRAAGAGRPERAEAPHTEIVSRSPADLDATGTTAVREFLRLVDLLAESWTAQPPALLRAGGIGVRELRRTAKALGVEETTAALVAEVAFAAGLINSTNGAEPVFLPSTEYDTWQGHDTASRWIALASAWLSMTRQPSLVSQRGERDRVINALGPDAERGTIPALRRQVLGVLAALAPGEAPARRSDVLALLAWRQPRRATGQRPLAEAILAEADQLGVTAAGGLTGYSRTLLDGWSGGPSAPASAAAEAALTRALPEPVDHFLVQPDLTVVVPGPPEAAMGAELALLADVESTGGASVYRITEQSVRRALDAGRSGETLAAFVARHSRTPVPQALNYLIDDAARRHGVLRAGTASSYLRCEDTALMQRVLADRAAGALGLHLIAPTVLVADAPVSRVLEVLRDAGYAPAAESAAGELITLGAERPRAPSRPASRPIVTRGAGSSATQAADLVRRIRAGDAVTERDRRVHDAISDVPGVTSAATMELLRNAVRDDRLVWLGVAQPDGNASAHELRPISLAGGFVRGYERGRAGLASYPVHRITAVRLVDEDDD